MLVVWRPEAAVKAERLQFGLHALTAEGHVLQIDSPDLGIERAGCCQDEPLPRFIDGDAPPP